MSIEEPIEKGDRPEPVEGASMAAGCLTIPGVLLSLFGMATGSMFNGRGLWVGIAQIGMLIVASFFIRSATSNGSVIVAVMIAIGLYALLWSICMAGALQSGGF